MPGTWSCTQHTAALLIQRTWIPPLATASFEYRTTHDVLALTILLATADTSTAGHWHDQLSAIKTVLEYDLEWALWCSNQLTQAPAHLPANDLDAAISKWTWLTQSHLLSGELSHRPGTYTGTATHPGAGVSIGVALAHRTLLNTPDASHHHDHKPACG